MKKIYINMPIDENSLKAFHTELKPIARYIKYWLVRVKYREILLRYVKKHNLKRDGELFSGCFDLYEDGGKYLVIPAEGLTKDNLEFIEFVLG